MEAKELMIKDWVLSDGEPTIVMQLDDVGNIFTAKNPYRPNVDVKPIPVTSEFLETNFKKRAEANIFFAHRIEIHPLSNKVISYTIKYNDLSDNCIDYFCNYVHELQHALRLCGLDNVANNFEIAKQ